MIFRFFTAASVLAVAACSAPEGAVSTSANAVPTELNRSLTQDQIGKCWAQAGLKGDLYKAMTPAEVQGISKVGGATKAQVKSFKSCLAV